MADGPDALTHLTHFPSWFLRGKRDSSPYTPRKHVGGNASGASALGIVDSKNNALELTHSEVRQDIEALARRLSRLCPSHRDPEAFHIEKAELVHALRRLARRGGRP